MRLQMLELCALQIDIFGSSRICCKCDSTSLVKQDQSAPLQRYLIFLLRMTGWYLFLWLITMSFSRWCELPISSVGVQDVLVGQLHPRSDKSGVLSLLMIQLVRIAELSIRTCRSFAGWWCSCDVATLGIRWLDMVPKTWMAVTVTNDFGMRRWIDEVWIKVGLLSCGVWKVDVVHFNL